MTGELCYPWNLWIILAVTAGTAGEGCDEDSEEWMVKWGKFDEVEVEERLVNSKAALKINGRKGKDNEAAVVLERNKKFKDGEDNQPRKE